MDNINNMREKFTNTFKNNSWHMGSGESKSGLGSSLDYTVNFRNNLTRIISEYNINNKYVVDVIQEIKRVSKYAIITSSNNSQLNKDINVDGVSSREINLDIIPYSDLLGKPIEKFYDSKGENKNTGCFGYLYSFT
jgi:hypothetical protein